MQPEGRGFKSPSVHQKLAISQKEVRKCSSTISATVFPNLIEMMGNPRTPNERRIRFPSAILALFLLSVATPGCIGGEDQNSTQEETNHETLESLEATIESLHEEISILNEQISNLENGSIEFELRKIELESQIRDLEFNLDNSMEITDDLRKEIVQLISLVENSTQELVEWKAAIYIPFNLDGINLEGRDRVPRTYLERTIDSLNFWDLEFEILHELSSVVSEPSRYDFLIIIDPGDGTLEDADNWSKSTGKPSFIIDTLWLESETSSFFNITDMGAGEIGMGWDYSNFDSYFSSSTVISAINPSRILFGASQWDSTPLIHTNSSLAMAHFSSNGTEHFLFIAESYSPGSGSTSHHTLILNYLDYSGFSNSKAEERCPVIFRLDDLRYDVQVGNWKDFTDQIPSYSLAIIPNSSNLDPNILKQNFVGGEFLLHGFDHEDWNLLNGSESYSLAMESIARFTEITGQYPSGMVMPLNHLDYESASGLSSAGLSWATSSISQSQFPSSFWFSENQKILHFSNYFEPNLYLDFIHFVESSCDELKPAMIVIHPNQILALGIKEEYIEQLQDLVQYIESSERFEIVPLGLYMENLILESQIEY